MFSQRVGRQKVGGYLVIVALCRNSESPGRFVRTLECTLPGFSLNRRLVCVCAYGSCAMRWLPNDCIRTKRSIDDGILRISDFQFMTDPTNSISKLGQFRSPNLA